MLLVSSHKAIWGSDASYPSMSCSSTFTLGDQGHTYNGEVP